jgi:hypothetical protein
MAPKPPTAPRAGRAQLQSCHTNALIHDAAQWLAELDRLKAQGSLLKVRKQPVTPRRKAFG